MITTTYLYFKQQLIWHILKDLFPILFMRSPLITQTGINHSYFFRARFFYTFHLTWILIVVSVVGYFVQKWCFLYASKMSVCELNLSSHFSPIFWLFYCDCGYILSKNDYYLTVFLSFIGRDALKVSDILIHTFSYFQLNYCHGLDFVVSRKSNINAICLYIFSAQANWLQQRNKAFKRTKP